MELVAVQANAAAVVHRKWRVVFRIVQQLSAGRLSNNWVCPYSVSGIPILVEYNPACTHGPLEYGSR